MTSIGPGNGESGTTSMLDSFASEPEFNDITPKPGSGRGFTLGELLLTGAIIAVLIAVLLPLSRGSRGAARRMQCTNNLKQIALALSNYEQEHKAFPPAYTTDANGRPLHSWRTLILPYLEQKSLYEKIDLSKPWNDPVNATASATKLAVFTCPEVSDAENTTAYLAIVGPDGFLVPGRPRRLEEITDGPSMTLAVIEAGEEDAVPWMAPLDAGAATLMKLDAKSKLHHAGGTSVSLADGRVQFLKVSTPAATRRALLTISGNDNDAIKEW
jgi:type II secretory pathway pseudopilin PulG